MRILTCVHTMEVGGSQINAIEIAGALAALGHEAIVYGPPGDLVPMVAEQGLRFIAAPPKGSRLSLRSMRRMRAVVRELGIDVVHGYEWSPTMDAAYGPYLFAGTPIVATVLSPIVPDFVPRFPLVVGVVELAEEESARRPEVHLIEPPVDTARNSPAVDVAAARARFSLEPDDIAVVTVARLVEALKGEGLRTAIEAIGRLGSSARCRLIVVGDGPLRAELQAAANAVNVGSGRPLVTLTGQLLDPRDAYAAADIVLGMGSSALKGMAFGKPLVVQGEGGFWRLLTAETLPFFLDGGWYARGDGGDGAAGLLEVLQPLAAEPARWASLGALGRQVVTERFSLEAAGRRQVEIYEGVVRRRRDGLVARLRMLAHPTLRYAIFRAALARQMVGRVLRRR
ncbi:glycosyltransferase family 4 protein [Microbacteriaceae bacterium VKM Ac-2855]|nr:glycosyltransferase family 4 protein [Microbacteriaceae bacterium VKM Ac-2855]